MSDNICAKGSPTNDTSKYDAPTNDTEDYMTRRCVGPALLHTCLKKLAKQTKKPAERTPAH